MATETKGEDHVMATTLLEFFSVSIQRDTQDQLNDGGSNSFQIYGHITLTNPYGREFFLFKRERRKPETVFMDNGTAILPKPLLPKPEGYYPHGLPEYFWVEVHLVDKSRNVNIVDQHICKLDFCQRKIPYDEEQELLIPSRGYGHVTLKYVVFRSALLALVSLGVSKNGTDVGAVTCSISADTNVKGKRELSRVLYHMNTTRRTRKSMPLTANDDYRCLPVVAVPAYSLLRITPDLKVDDKPIFTGDDALEFKPENTLLVPECKEIIKEIMGVKWCICLKVFWIHPYDHLDRDEFDGELVRFWDESCLRAGLSGAVNNSKEKRFYTICSARKLVEVFSVYVGSFGQEHPLRVYGTIEYIGSCKKYPIFEREVKEPEKVLPSESLSLRNPPDYERVVGPFDIHLDLKDAAGREISKGTFGWGFSTAEAWYNRRICSVVTGEHGFACVHYAMLRRGVSAKVCARLCFDRPRCFEVSGSIYARYSTYRYSTNYEKNFYRSRLFKKKKKKKNSTQVHCDPDLKSDLPLSKDVVAVPCGNQLILEVDIHVWDRCELEETFGGKLAFNPENSTILCAKVIEGRKSCAKVFKARKSPLLVRREKIQHISEQQVGPAREKIKRILELEVGWD